MVTPSPALSVARAQPMGLQLSSIKDMFEFARMVVGTDFAPKGFNTPEKVLVAIQYGAEVGLNPLQALQSIAVINGRPSLFGDAMLGLVKSHPSFVSISERYVGSDDDLRAECTVTRRGEPPVTRDFSVRDAKRANLWGKQGPWIAYPQRMLLFRARGFALRDSFPDALKGLILAEEAMDTPVADATAVDAGAADVLGGRANSARPPQPLPYPSPATTIPAVALKPEPAPVMREPGDDTEEIAREAMADIVPDERAGLIADINALFKTYKAKGGTAPIKLWLPKGRDDTTNEEMKKAREQISSAIDALETK